MSKLLSNEELDELWRIASEAQDKSPGPWEWFREDGEMTLRGPECPVLFACTIGPFHNQLSVYPWDATFIAKLNPATVLRLLEELQVSRRNR